MKTLNINNFILCAGVGHSTDELTAFDRALIDAQVSSYNLVKVSSILPPDCKLQNNISLAKGLILPSAFSVISSNRIGEIISAAVAVGIPDNSSDIGVIMKYSAYDTQEKTEIKVRELVEQAMIDRDIKIKTILSISKQCVVESHEIYCSFATVSMW